MKKMLLSDLVVLEQQCNSNCEYCLTSDSKLKEEHLKNRTEDGKIQFIIKDELGRYCEGSPLKAALDTILNRMHDYFDTPWLITSGGEIFLNDGIVEYLEYAAQIFPVVQVLTNGTLLDEVLIKRISQSKNIHISITLDGHTVELNRYRTNNATTLNNILHNIELLNKYQMPTEIFCVITNANCGKISSYVEYLSKYDNVKLFFFPVRGKPGKNFFPSDADIKEFEKLLTDYDRYKKVLLPKAYVSALCKYLKGHNRERRCYIPQLTAQTFHDGIVTPCPFSWSQPIYNILETDHKTAIEKTFNNSFVRMASAEHVFMPFCKKCFNHLDIANLFIDDEISLEELKSIPIFAEPAVIERLQYIKDKIRSGKSD